MDRRAALRVAGSLGLAAVAGCLGGPEAAVEESGENGGTSPRSPAGASLGPPPSLSSPAFADGGPVPVRFTCDGEDVSPPLAIADVPETADWLALVVDDPDAPGGTFTHWLLWGLPASSESIPEAVPRGGRVDALGGASQGTNDAGRLGYSGPCPPPGDGPHTYWFRLLALGEPLGLAPAADRAAFDDALAGAASVGTVLRGTYGR